MPQRTSAAQAPANLAPVVTALAVVGGLVAMYFQLPGALIIAVGVTVASFFYNAAPQLNPKDPVPDEVQRERRRWTELRWRALVPSFDWLVNTPGDFSGFLQKGQAAGGKLGARLPGPLGAVAGFIGWGIGALMWFVWPSRFTPWVAIAAALAMFSLPIDLARHKEWLPEEVLGYDLSLINALYAYGIVMAVDAVIRRSAALMDPSPGVAVSVLTSKAAGGDGGAWRALIGFPLLGISVGVGVVLTVLSVDLTAVIPNPILFAVGAGIATAAGCLHGAARNAGLENWRDRVRARAEWVPRWEALKYPDVQLVDHQRVGPYVIDTFEAPPSLGSNKAINLYSSIVPYLAAGGDVTVAMLTVPAADSQGQPIPGSAHATRFRIAWAPGDSQVETLNPEVDLDHFKIAAEVGAFLAANEMAMPVPVLLEVEPAHTPDSAVAVWQTQWTAPLASAATVAWTLGVDAETGHHSEGNIVFFGDFEEATLADQTLPARIERAAYEARWGQRWQDALKMGEKPPHLQYGAIKKERLSPGIELTYEPFLVSQGLNTEQFFKKDMRTRIVTTLKAAPFLAVVGITGPLAGNLGPGVRHGQGFAVVHSATAIPANPGEIASPGPRAREVTKWVMGGLINRAFEDAKLPYPEVIAAEALTRPQSKGHVWKVHLRLYDGVTAATLKLNHSKLTQSLGGVRWLRFEESEYGAYVVMGAQPHAEGVRFSNPQALAYCDKLDWAQAFQDSGIRSVSDGSSPTMLENEPLESNERVTRMVFAMPQGSNLGKIVEATEKLRSATANEYVEIRPAETPDKFVVLAAEQNPIPFPAYPDYDLLASLEGKGRHRLPFAATTDGSTVSFDWTLDPHLNVLGASGGGKSILLQVLMTGAIFRDCDVFLIDPIKGGQDFDFAVPYVRAMVPQGDYLGAGELLQLIGQEAESRKKLNVMHKVGNYKDLPDGVRPRHMFVIIDEFQSLLKSQAKGLKEPTSGDESEMAIFEAQRNINIGVGKVATHIGKLAREARSVGITLVLAGQAMKATDLEAVGLGGLKVNFSRIAVGKMSYGEMASAFKDPSTLPNLGAVVPPGRGIFESTAAAAITVQNWWEPGGQEELGRRLRERVQPIDDSRRVNVEELSQRVLASAPKAFGAVMEEYEVEDEDDEVTVELDADELGLSFDDLSFDDDFTLEAPPVAEPVAVAVDDFTLMEPPTDLPLHAEQQSAPEQDRFDLAGPLLFHEGQFTDDVTGLSGRVTVGDTVQFGVNAPTGDGSETGWPEGDALLRLLRANPGIMEVVWVDSVLDELDEIGIPRVEIARDVCAKFSVTLHTVDPELSLGFDVEEDEPLAQPVAPPAPVVQAPPAPASAPVPAPAPQQAFVQPTLFDFGDVDFDGPKPNVPPPNEADDIFGGPKLNAPPIDINF